MLTILLVISGISALYYFLIQSISQEDKWKLQNWAHIGYAAWVAITLRGHSNGEHLLGISIIANIFYLSSLVTYYGLDNTFFILMHKDIKKLDWGSVQTDDMAAFMGDANITGRKISSIDNIIVYDLLFTHPVFRSWYYATFTRIITCTHGEIKFLFKDSNREIVLAEGDSLRIHKKEIVAIKTLKDSQISVVCIR